MINSFSKSFYKNGYLLIIAAWLYTISFIFSNYLSYTSSPRRVAQQLESYIKDSEEKFANFTADSAALTEAVDKTAPPKQGLKYLKEEIGFYVYTQDEVANLSLTFWSNNKMVPDAKELLKPDGKHSSRNTSGQFEFIKKTIQLRDKQVVAAALIPVHWTYFINNEYLRSDFESIEGLEKRYTLVDTAADVYVHNGDGKALFGLKEKKNNNDESPGTISLTLRILSVLFALIFLNAYAFEVVNKKGWIKGFAFLAVTVFILRLISYLLPGLFPFRNLGLFDATVYASNKLHPSLGDLFINIILLFWMISFVKFAGTNYFKQAKKIRGNTGWIVTAILCVFLILLSFLSAGIIRSLIVDSKIPFDVTNFFQLNFYSLCSFIILCFIILTFFHFSHIALLYMYKATDVPIYGKYLVVAVAGMVYLTFNLNNPVSSGNLIVLIWLLIFMAIMEYRKEDIFVPILRSSFFLIWIIFFAGSISALIIYENHYNELAQRRRKAEQIVSQTDKWAENQMSIEIGNISNDFLASNFFRFNYPTPNKTIKDSLLNANFSGYLDKYETRIYTYDSSFRPLFNDDNASYAEISNLVYNRSKRTQIGDIYYYETGFSGYSYLYQKAILSPANDTLGYFFVVANANKYKRQALGPELFKNGENLETELDLNYAYAVYNKGRIVSTAGDYNFKSFIPKNELPRQEFIEYQKSDVTELWYNAANNKLVIIVKSGSVFFEAITLFAYLFASFLFVVIAFQAVHFLIKNKFRLSRLKTGLRLSIRTQVQGTIIFISIFSFLVIGVATISFYINRFGQTNRERLVRAIQVITDEVKSNIAAHAATDDYLKVYDPELSSEFDQSIKEIAEIHNVDINFYDLNGLLRISTQPYIYEKEILSNMMSPAAFFSLHYENNIRFIQNEKFSNFSFISIYMPVKDEDGETYAYVNIPYLNTQKELNQEISNFLVTLINLNAFIFVIAGAIAVFLTNRITNSFLLIASKMRVINLGQANEEIKWNTNDEIGALVNEYNKMVKKLDDSAHALAKSEREGAWREMARQVAHEIKNPLTPMKLSIQYLQRAIQEKNPNTEALSQKVTATLVEQIDQLAKIASDFSQFANIGNIKFEVFDVNEILTSLVNLYSTNQQLRLEYSRPQKPALINADRTQINRLFTNLFQNAIEASEGKDIIPIIIKQEMNDNKLLIKVCDEGSGIPLEKQEKIFTPNFTTKTSGTGLGLAMCKGIVEKANGHIWFKTEEGKGTTFHVLLPLVGIPE